MLNELMSYPVSICSLSSTTRLHSRALARVHPNSPLSLARWLCFNRLIDQHTHISTHTNTLSSFSTLSDRGHWPQDGTPNHCVCNTHACPRIRTQWHRQWHTQTQTHTGLTDSDWLTRSRVMSWTKASRHRIAPMMFTPFDSLTEPLSHSPTPRSPPTHPFYPTAPPHCQVFFSSSSLSLLSPHFLPLPHLHFVVPLCLSCRCISPAAIPGRELCVSTFTNKKP